MKIILSAFACDPNRGSESTVGWNWAKALSKYNDVYVLTREYNKNDIEKEIIKHNINNIKFLYYDLPKKYDWFFMRDKYTAYLYYIAWQYNVYKILKNSNEYKKFDLIQHITYVTFKSPGYLWKLDNNFIMGPIGGGQVIPKGFKDCFKKHIIIELIRKVINYLIIKTPYLKKAYNKSKVILVANEETEKLINRINFNNIKVIRMSEGGIQRSKLHKVERRLKYENKVTLMWAGHSQYIKALILFIKALARVKNIDKIIVKLVGNIDVEKYTKVANTYGVRDIVQFTGVVQYNEMDELYKQSDIFVFTSLRDTTGTVVLEAMANSLPVITLNHQGVKDVVENNCGIKIEPKNTEYVVNELAKSIDKLVEDKKLRCEMGENSFNRVRDKYLWEEKAKEMTRIYNNILKGDCNESFDD